MKTVLATVVVLAATQLCLLLGTLCHMILSFIFSWLPDKVRTNIQYVTVFLSGAFGSVISIGFAYLVFRLIAGVNTLHFGIFIAATISLLKPLWNDYKAAARSQNALKQPVSEKVKELFRPQATRSRNWFIGELTGLILSLVFMIKFYP